MNQRSKREDTYSMLARFAYAAAAALAVAIGAGPAVADTPGVTATEIKIGNTVPYSGPASSYSVLGKLESAFFNMVNEQGGVAGHKINFISLDDDYSPPKTVEQIRRLVEEDKVAFMFATLGTPTNSADRALHEPEEGAATVRLDRRGQMGRLQAHAVDHRLAAQLPHRGADLYQVHAAAEAERQDRASCIRTTTSVRTTRPA